MHGSMAKKKTPEYLQKVENLLSADYANKEHKDYLQEKAAEMNIPIVSDSLSYLSYTFDRECTRKEDPKAKGLFPFFQKNKGVHAMCDYMLFCWYNHKLFILLVELKHGKDNTREQLKAGICFAQFIVNTLNRVEKKINITPEIRQITIRNKHIIKKRTTRINDVEYDRDNFCTFEGGKFYLKEFLK